MRIGFITKTAGIYASLACIYILFSDTAVHAFVADPDWRYQLSVWKGFGFIAFTSAALAFLLRAELAKRDALHRELEAAERRWRFALEGAGHGVWEWNAKTGEAFHSRDWKAMLGYGDEDIDPTYEAWASRLHPEDRARVQAALAAHLEGRTESYASEHRLRCKDGSYKWVLDRGRVAERDADGKPLIVLGTHTDLTLLRRVQAELDSSQRFLSDLVASSDALVFAKDREGRYVLTNPKWEATTGLPSGQAIGRTDEALFPAARAKSFRDNDLEVMRRGAPLQFEEVLDDASGTRHFLSVKFPLRDAEGGITGVCGVTTEITDRKRAEEALRHSESLYREMFEASPHPMWVFELGSLRFLAVNDAAVANYGYSREEFLAMTLADIRPPEDVPRLRATVEDEKSDPLRQVGLWRHRRKDGSLIDVEITTHSLAFEGRQGRLVLAQDVTDRLRAERERNDALAMFRALTEQSLAGIYMVDDGKVTYANPRVAAIFGYRPEEVIGLPYEAFYQPEEIPAARERVRRRLAGESMHELYEFRGRRKDGGSILVGVAGSIAKLDGRKVLMGVMQDITDKAALEAREREYMHRLEHAVRGTVNAVSKMMDLRDPYTAGHEIRVGLIAAAIAGEMGLDEATQEGLRIAGAVHDVGKITVPAEILSKPGRLTPAEFAIVKTHAEQGYEILKDIDSPWPLADVARQHHERMDGSGYPRGLKGDSIVLEARILAVADVVESMASHRPYRPTLGIVPALEEIEKNAGSLYDPAVAAACLRLFRERGYALPT